MKTWLAKTKGLLIAGLLESGCLPTPVNRGQRLTACTLLDVALELFGRCRGAAAWMPNDSYDLAHAAALTATHTRPVVGGGSLAVSAAAVTDHVRDNWYGA